MRHPNPGGLITTSKISMADIIEVPVKNITGISKSGGGR